MCPFLFKISFKSFFVWFGFGFVRGGGGRRGTHAFLVLLRNISWSIQILGTDRPLGYKTPRFLTCLSYLPLHCPPVIHQDTQVRGLCSCAGNPPQGGDSQTVDFLSLSVPPFSPKGLQPQLNQDGGGQVYKAPVWV